MSTKRKARQQFIPLPKDEATALFYKGGKLDEAGIRALVSHAVDMGWCSYPDEEVKPKRPRHGPSRDGALTSIEDGIAMLMRKPAPPTPTRYAA